MIDLDAQIRNLYEQVQARQEPVTLAEIQTSDARVAVAHPTPSPQQRQRRWVAGAVSAVLVLMAVFVAILAQQSDDEAPVVTQPTSPTTVLESTPTTVGDGTSTGAAIPRYPLLATEGAYWFVGRYGESEGLVRIDAVTLQVTDAIPAGDSPTHVIPTEDGLWVLDSDAGKLFLVDTATREVIDSIESLSRDQTLGGGQVLEPVLVGETLWVHTHTQNQTVVELDLATQEVISETPVGMNSPWWADAVDGAIWSYAPSDGLRRFDPNTLEVDVFRGTSVGHTEECCLATDDAIWMISHEGQVSRFDVATHVITDRLDLAQSLRAGVIGGGAIWVPSGQYGDQGTEPGPVGVVYRIDLETREVTDAIPVDAQPRDPVLADGAIWVSHIDGTLSRIDVETRQVTRTVEVGNQPHDLYVIDGAVWIAYPDAGTISRIDP